MIAFTAFLLLPWFSQQTRIDQIGLGILCIINAFLWWIVLWWSLHHLTYKLLGLWQESTAKKTEETVSQASTSFVLLYPTCDDFQWHACKSCITQDYPTEHLQVVICDDSTESSYKSEIDRFAAQFPTVRVVRRDTRVGFKAGNLNNALAQEDVQGEWIVIVDADQNLPQSYVSQFAREIASVNRPRVAYIQGRQESDHVLPANSTRFQQTLGREIDIFYRHDLALRTQYGFLPLVGHGAALRYKAWQEVRFPEVVSEDFAMCMELRNKAWIGQYAENIRAWESFPESFDSFLIRYLKFAGGTGELYRKHLKPFLLGPATFTEKVDLLMMVGWYALMPIVILNGYLSVFVCHWLWGLGVSALHPVLPFVFLFMYLAQLPMLYSAAPSLGAALQQGMWSSAIYGACLPIAAIRFLRNLLPGSSPRFDRTPKGEQVSALHLRTKIGMVSLGISTIALALILYSPFRPVLLGLGLSYTCLPLYSKLNESTLAGMCARSLVTMPGVFYVYALYEMWKWGTI